MSRLIVKNLPTSVTTEKLRELFSEKGLVTDVQLKYTRDGKFRHFGFVGYKTEEAAQRAVEYFNGTFIKTCKINVEVCAGLGDSSKPKAWSKYAPDSSAYKKEHKEVEEKKNEGKERKSTKTKKNIVQEAVEKYKDDAQFLEFMESHTKGKKGIWNNDDAIPKNETKYSDVEEDGDSSHEHEDISGSEKEEQLPIDNVAKRKISDIEYLKMKTIEEGADSGEDEEEDKIKEKAKIKHEVTKEKLKPKKCVQLYTVKVKGLPRKPRKQDVKKLFKPLKLNSIRIPQNQLRMAYVGFATERDMKKALLKHLSFLDGKRLWVTRSEAKIPTTKVEEMKNSKWIDQEVSLKNEETIAESGRIFVRNLSYTITEDDIEKHFSKYGEITEVVMPVDRFTRKAKGFAVITFLIPEHAAKAYMELDGTAFQGRMLHLLPGKAKETLQELLEKEGLTYKQKQLLKKKAEAVSSHNWNTLFLGQNAVADLIADTYNTTKEQVLDSSGKGSVAVRLALGETQIVTQMRDFLEENGVCLDAFNRAPRQRSKTVILAKNLPAKSTEAEIRQLFMKFGELGRVLLHPSGVTAIVEFLEPSEAKTALTRLAYSKFKNLPLYLEWAPSDTFKTPPSKPKPKPKSEEIKENADGNKDADASENKEEESKKAESDSSGEEDTAPEPDTTLYIKNLNFATEMEQVKEHFKKCGRIHEVIVSKKKDPKNPGRLLSMGFGFIQFKEKASADKALKTMQQTVLDGHSIEIKRSNRNTRNEVASARKSTKIGEQTGTKILVRNIPFQATRSEIMELFSTFGKIKALRLPLKMVGTGSHRGFAFVDFYTKHDAKRAFKGMCQSTHLYGRRLVLEWASTVDNIDDIRKRTAEGFIEGPSNKTLKKSVANLDIVQDSD